MTQMIIRSFASEAQSTKAGDALRAFGFEDVFQLAKPMGKAGTKATAHGALVADLMKINIWKSHAETYAHQLSKGGAMVIVHAPFGSALKAAELMDQFNPVDSGIADTSAKSGIVWDDAAPLSSALQMPVLTSVKLPAETLTGISSLTKGTAFLSTFLGMRLLSKGLAHATTSMGFPLLSHSATPLSSALGMKTSLKNATPLSSLFGLPVLKSH